MNYEFLLEETMREAPFPRQHHASLRAISVKSWTDGVRVQKPIFWLKVRPVLRRGNALHETAKRKPRCLFYRLFAVTILYGWLSSKRGKRARNNGWAAAKSYVSERSLPTWCLRLEPPANGSFVCVVQTDAEVTCSLVSTKQALEAEFVCTYSEAEEDERELHEEYERTSTIDGGSELHVQHLPDVPTVIASGDVVSRYKIIRKVLW
uniref:Uncharacterized protein n=1 Tax=Vespula pensylvanica TaxID=30213 RepID=A0A834PBC5_VESPE|nr:hypothetical protein H0235_002635 [Vespula pensylvanica]